MKGTATAPVIYLTRCAGCRRRTELVAIVANRSVCVTCLAALVTADR